MGSVKEGLDEVKEEINSWSKEDWGKVYLKMILVIVIIMLIFKVGDMINDNTRYCDINLTNGDTIQHLPYLESVDMWNSKNHYIGINRKFPIASMVCYYNLTKSVK